MSNRFALLADDGGSGDERPAAPAPKVNADKPAAAPKKVAPAPNNAKANQQAQAGSRSKDSYPGRTGQGRKVLKDESGPTEGTENTKRSGDSTRGSSRGRGGRGRGRGARPDRHSQMDREVSEKANNQAWGGNEGQRELDAETNAQQDADREAATQSGTATPAAEPQEPEDNTQSYSEYLASQAKAAGEGLAAKLGLNTNKPRQANEGADENQWKNAKPVSKDEEEEALFTGSGKDKKKSQKQKDGKTFIEFDTPAYRPQTSGRGGARGSGRGGAGGAAPRGNSRGRGSGGRGGGRGGSRQGSGAAGPDLSNEAAFPSLS